MRVPRTNDKHGMAKGGSMIVEMRTYRIKSGLRDRFAEIFLARTMPEHARLGMKIAGPFLAVDDADVLFFMRGFPDQAARETMKAEFYEGDLWRNELEGVMMPMLASYDVVVIDDRDERIRW